MLFGSSGQPQKESTSRIKEIKEIVEEYDEESEEEEEPPVCLSFITTIYADKTHPTIEFAFVDENSKNCTNALAAIMLDLSDTRFCSIILNNLLIHMADNPQDAGFITDALALVKSKMEDDEGDELVVRPTEVFATRDNSV